MSSKEMGLVWFAIAFGFLLHTCSSTDQIDELRSRVTHLENAR